MKLNKKLLATGVLAASLFTGQAWGAVSAEEAAKLRARIKTLESERSTISARLATLLTT